MLYLVVNLSSQSSTHVIGDDSDGSKVPFILGFGSRTLTSRASLCTVNDISAVFNEKGSTASRRLGRIVVSSENLNTPLL